MKPKAKPERDWRVHNGFELRKQCDPEAKLTWNVYGYGRHLARTGESDLAKACAYIDRNQEILRAARERL